MCLQKDLSFPEETHALDMFTEAMKGTLHKLSERCQGLTTPPQKTAFRSCHQRSTSAKDGMDVV